MKKLILLGCFLPALCQAQNYSISWFKIAGGGGSSSGGLYSLSGTIGQPDAGATMSGGAYTLTGGFWSLVSAVQTPGLPDLTISHAGASVIISWPNTGEYTLQKNNVVNAAANWIPSGYTVTSANGTNSVTIPQPSGTLFFRLSSH